MLDKHGASALDVDILQVSHHGSSNGTTAELLDRVSPELALLGTGDPHAAKTGPRGATDIHGVTSSSC